MTMILTIENIDRAIDRLSKSLCPEHGLYLASVHSQRQRENKPSDPSKDFFVARPRLDCEACVAIKPNLNSKLKRVYVVHEGPFNGVRTNMSPIEVLALTLDEDD